MFQILTKTLLNQILGIDCLLDGKDNFHNVQTDSHALTSTMASIGLYIRFPSNCSSASNLAQSLPALYHHPHHLGIQVGHYVDVGGVRAGLGSG